MFKFLFISNISPLGELAIYSVDSGTLHLQSDPDYDTVYTIAIKSPCKVIEHKDLVNENPKQNPRINFNIRQWAPQSGLSSMLWRNNQRTVISLDDITNDSQMAMSQSELSNSRNSSEALAEAQAYAREVLQGAASRTASVSGSTALEDSLPTNYQLGA